MLERKCLNPDARDILRSSCTAKSENLDETVGTGHAAVWRADDVATPGTGRRRKPSRGGIGGAADAAARPELCIGPGGPQRGPLVRSSPNPYAGRFVPLQSHAERARQVDESAEIGRLMRFYFDLTNGQTTMRDDEGAEADDLAEATDQAQIVIEELRTAGALMDVEDDWQLVIRTDDGTELRRIPIAARD